MLCNLDLYLKRTFNFPNTPKITDNMVFTTGAENLVAFTYRIKLFLLEFS